MTSKKWIKRSKRRSRQFGPLDLRPPVSLHDRYATDIRREGDNLVFVFSDGFDLIDWTDKTTSRTCLSEMRLRWAWVLEIVFLRCVKRQGRRDRLYRERTLSLPELIAKLRSGATIEFLYDWHASGSALWQCCLYQGANRDRTDDLLGKLGFSCSHEGIEFVWMETMAVND